MADAGRRGIERELAANPGDGDGWLRLAHQQRRQGQEGAASALTLAGLRAHPEHEGLLARATELHLGRDPWPSEAGGGDQACSSALPGPSEGVQRWRLELPYEPVGCPLVRSDGSIFVRLFPAGILRVAADASSTSVHSDWWPSGVPPVLREGLPVAFDPGLDEVSGAGVDALAPQELWPAAIGADGWTYACGPGQIVGVGLEPGERWVNAAVRGCVRLALGPDGALAATRGAGGVHVLAERGSERFEEYGAERAAFAPDGSLVIGGIPLQRREIACFEADGELRWQRPFADCCFAVDADCVVAASSADGVAAIDLATGKTRWQQPELRTAAAVSVDVRGFAYVLGPGWFAGIRSDGSLLFRLPLPTRGARGGVALGRDRTAFVTVGQELVAIR